MKDMLKQLFAFLLKSFNNLNDLQKQLVKIVGVLVLITAIVLFLNFIAFKLTKSEVHKNEQKHLLDSLKLVTGDIKYENNLLKSKQIVGGRVEYQTCLNGKTKLTIAEISTNKGYSGEIKLLLSFDEHAKLVKVYALSHNETPGLGDQIDTKKSSWINQFEHLSLLDKIALKKDGGKIDAISGATISSRAVTNAVADYAKDYKALTSQSSYCSTLHEAKHDDKDKKDKKGKKDKKDGDDHEN